MNEDVPIDERHQVNNIAIIVAARRGFRSGFVAASGHAAWATRVC